MIAPARISVSRAEALAASGPAIVKKFVVFGERLLEIGSPRLGKSRRFAQAERWAYAVGTAARAARLRSCRRDRHP
jgi:hypothetical protein